MNIIKIARITREQQVNPAFSGPVSYQRIIGADMSNSFRITQVNFNEGVTNKFHSHTGEQVLFITEGKGIVATDKEQIEVSTGDIIFFPAGEKHRHGAAKNATFSHIVVMSSDSKTTLFGG